MLFNKILVYFTEVVPEIVWAATVVVNLIYLAGKKVLSFFFCLCLLLEILYLRH